jgi:outer membrane receptor protein involved in Fe transport
LAQPTVLTADIPAQPLARALDAFSRQTGLHLVYISGVIRDQRSRAVSAGLGVDDALARLLEGTGLEFRYLTPHSIRILASTKSDVQAPAAEEIPEIIVSANRRDENLQNVPITIQALTGDTLVKLNATTFDDFVSYLPGVSAHGVGPAQNNIYVRGLATSVAGIQSAGVTGSFPNVAVYLDEQSAQLPFRNLDVYAADIERIEVLEGPQGTLFGAGAQAGVVRYITNKPNLNVTEALLHAGYATTAHGEPSANVDATINLPIIPDKFAMRGVIYNEKRGGYISNVPATFARADTDLGIHYANFPAGCGPVPPGPPCQVPPNAPVINNAGIAGSAINPVTYTGIRVAALYRFNDDWSGLMVQSYQNIEADGVFTQMATNSLGEPQPDLSVQLYNPSYDKDRFENTALTVEGRVGAWKLLYAGAYLVRSVDQRQDYTNYARGAYADFYQCVNPSAASATAQCFTPSSTWRDQERNTHLSQELRVSSPVDSRVRGIGGLFYEDYRIEERADWLYLTATPYFHPIGPPTGYYTLNGSPTLPNGQPVPYYWDGAVFVSASVTSINPNVRPPDDGYFEDITRGYTQKAAYLSVDFDLVPNTLILTAGTRYYDTNTWQVGSSVGGFGCQIVNQPSAPNPCLNHSNFVNIDAQGLNQTYSGFKSRATLSWNITEDALLYYTWSQGFRAGGFNRSTAVGASSPLAAGNNRLAYQHGGWVPPVPYAPDSLTNNEFGWKSQWLNRIQWNGAIYQEDWDDAQIGAFRGGAIGSNVVTINGGNYRVRGLETSGVVRVGDGLTIEGAASWNHSELVKEATFLWADGTPIDFNALQAVTGVAFSNPGGTLGSPLAGAPPFQGNLRVRYEYTVNDYGAFAQIATMHQSHSLSTTNQVTDPHGDSTAYDLPAFTTYDGSVGVGKDGWLVEMYAENLTDTRAQLYANYSQYYKAVTVNRPRTIGVRFSYKIGAR